MNYLGKPTVITRVPIRKRQEHQSQRREGDDRKKEEEGKKDFQNGE